MISDTRIQGLISLLKEILCPISGYKISIIKEELSIAGFIQLLKKYCAYIKEFEYKIYLLVLNYSKMKNFQQII